MLLMKRLPVCFTKERRLFARVNFFGAGVLEFEFSVVFAMRAV
jgi:hypothetical protein